MNRTTHLAALAASAIITMNMVCDRDVAPEYSVCRTGDAAACKHWRDRECNEGSRTACDYYVARKQKDPSEWCAQRYEAVDYRFCTNGSPDR